MGKSNHLPVALHVLHQYHPNSGYQPLHSTISSNMPSPRTWGNICYIYIIYIYVCVYPTSRKITSIYNQFINHRFGYCQFYLYVGFNKWWYPKNSWFIMENPIKIDDLEVSLFQETSTCGWVGKESQSAVCWGMDINKLRVHSQGARVPSATARYHWKIHHLVR
jgi:hypothetical protein